MRRAIVFACLACLCLGTPALAQRYNQFQIQFVDEFGEPVNMTTSASLYIYEAGSTTELTCYKDRAGTLTVTQPVTDDSTNTPLDYSTGLLTFWVAAGSYKITATDGTFTRSVDNLSSGDGRFAWPSYLSAMSGSSYGQSNDIDFTHAGWIIDGDTAGRLDMIPDSDAGIIGIGDATHNADVIFYAAADKLMTFNEGDAELLFTDLDIQLDDDSDLIIGTGNDFVIDSDTAKTLDITPAATDETAIVNLGANTTGVDLKLFAATTADYLLWDASDEQLEGVGIAVTLDDDSDLSFGSGADFVLDSDTAKRLDFTPAAASDDYLVYLGADESGVDLKIFGATTGEYWSFDASADSVIANLGNVSYTTTDAEANQFKVDATGATTGEAILLETTTGGIKLLADGATQGDIDIDCEDDLTLTAAGDLTLAVTGTYSVGGAAVTNQLRPVEHLTADDTLGAAESGKVVYVQKGSSGGAGPSDVVVTLPAAAAGLWFTIVDANETAAADVTITAGAGDKINDGSAAASYVHDTDADNYAAVTLVAIDATDWVVLSSTGTWSNE